MRKLKHANFNEKRNFYIHAGMKWNQLVEENTKNKTPCSIQILNTN